MKATKQTKQAKQDPIIFSLEEATEAVVGIAHLQVELAQKVLEFKLAEVDWKFHKTLRAAYMKRRMELKGCTHKAAKDAWEKLCRTTRYKAPKSQSAAAKKKRAQREKAKADAPKKAPEQKMLTVTHKGISRSGGIPIQESMKSMVALWIDALSNAGGSGNHKHATSFDLVRVSKLLSDLKLELIKFA